MIVRAAAIAVLLSALAAGTLAVPAAAATAVPATAVYRFTVDPGTTCPRGYGVADETVTVTLRDSQGKRLARHTAHADATNGSFAVCLGVAATPGRKLTVKGTAGSHTLVVPSFDARVDRVTNVLTGHAPAAVSISGYVYQCVPGLCAPEVPIALTASPQGTFHKDLSPTDIDGAEFVSMAFTTQAGDTILRSANAPYMEVRLRRSNQVRMWPVRSGPVTITLRASGGTLRASATQTLKAGKAATFTFRRNGNPVRIRAGDRVDADFASDAHLTAPAVGLTFDVPGAKVTGHCFADEWLTVTVDPPVGETTRSNHQAASDSSFSAEVGSLQGGSKVTVDCQDRHGDRFRLSGEVPSPG